MTDPQPEESRDPTQKAAVEFQLESTREIEAVLRRSRPVVPSLRFEAIERAIAQRDSDAQASSMRIEGPLVLDFSAVTTAEEPSRRIAAMLGSWCFGATVGAAAAVVVMLSLRPSVLPSSSPVTVHPGWVEPVASSGVGKSQPPSGSNEGVGTWLDANLAKSDGELDARHFASDRLLMQIANDPQLVRTGKWRTLIAFHRNTPHIRDLDRQAQQPRDAAEVPSAPVRKPIEFDASTQRESNTTPTRHKLWQELIEDPEMLL